MAKIGKKKTVTVSNDDKDREKLNHSYIATETAE